MTPTRFEPLGLDRIAGGRDWSFFDCTEKTPARVGPIYKSKAEALGDLERYARECWGHNSDSEALALELPAIPRAGWRWTEKGWQSCATHPTALVILSQPNHGALVAHCEPCGTLFPCRTVRFGSYYDDCIRAWIETAREKGQNIVDLRGVKG